MARTQRTVSEPQPMCTIVTDKTCDGCGQEISDCNHDEQFAAHKLIVMLDPSECVNFYRLRDYCPRCVEPVWTAINALITASPDDERDREYGNEYI